MRQSSLLVASRCGSVAVSNVSNDSGAAAADSRPRWTSLVETAVRIDEECDGIEYETSAVRLDLRFIPDSMIFDSSIIPHDQCTQLSDKSVYKPIRFRNTALTQTKVRCTWDETPIERRRLTKKRNYTVEQLDQVNLDAYLASESDEEIQNNYDNDNNI